MFDDVLRYGRANNMLPIFLRRRLSADNDMLQQLLPADADIVPTVAVALMQFGLPIFGRHQLRAIATMQFRLPNVVQAELRKLLPADAEPDSRMA